MNKNQLRKSFPLPVQGRIALALGYATSTKGWDIIKEVDIPDNWTIVINPSKNEYRREEYHINAHKSNLKNLCLDFLNEEQLRELFSCADAVILPYKVSSASGVLVDGLSYGLPFVASNRVSLMNSLLKAWGLLQIVTQQLFQRRCRASIKTTTHMQVQLASLARR